MNDDETMEDADDDTNKPAVYQLTADQIYVNRYQDATWAEFSSKSRRLTPINCFKHWLRNNVRATGDDEHALYVNLFGPGAAEYDEDTFWDEMDEDDPEVPLHRLRDKILLSFLRIFRKEQKSCGINMLLF